MVKIGPAWCRNWNRDNDLAIPGDRKPKVRTSLPLRFTQAERSKISAGKKVTAARQYHLYLWHCGRFRFLRNHRGKMSWLERE